MRLLAALLALAALAPSCGMSQENADRLEDYQRRATLYYDSNDLVRAEQQARLGLALDPEHARLNLILGRALLRWKDLRSVARSRQYLEKAFQEAPDFRSAYSLGEFHLRYAEFLVGKGEERQARALELESAEPEAASDLVERAEHVRERAAEHLADAERLLVDALAESPKNIYTLRLLASCYAHQDRDDEALATVDELVKQLRASRGWKNERLAIEALDVAEESRLRQNLRGDLDMEVEARGLAAAIYKAQRRYRESEEQLTEILRINPELEREYFNRGMCRYWSGDLAGSATDMKEFLRRTKLDFEAEEVSQALDIVAEFEARDGRSSARSGG